MTRKSATHCAVCVVGVPGVGKSTLLAKYAGAHPQHARHVVGSSIVKQVIAPATVRDLDGFSPSEQEAVRAECIRRLTSFRDAFDGLLFVDGHVTLRNRASGRLETVFTPADESFYGAIVLVDADVERVHGQRAADARVRETEVVDGTLAHIETERALARDAARRMGVPFASVDGVTLDERVTQLQRFTAMVEALLVAS